MSKAVAIPYIIALAIGLIVLAVMVYIFLKVTSSKELPAEECRSRFIDWCVMCLNSGWPESGLTIPQKLRNECTEVLTKHLGFSIGDQQNDHCGTWKTKADCCTVGVKNEVCP